MIAINISIEYLREFIDCYSIFLRDQYDIKDVIIEPPDIRCRYVLDILGMGTKIVPITISLESYDNDLWIHIKTHFGYLSSIASRLVAEKIAKILGASNHGGTITYPMSDKLSLFTIAMSEDYLRVRFRK